MKRWMLGLTISSLLLLTALPAHALPGVDMKTEVAGGGRVRTGGWATVLVDLTNQGGELNAELVAKEDDGGPPMLTQPEYVVPLTLPAGGKKRVPLFLPTFGSGQVTVTLRSGGKVIQEQNVTIMNMTLETLFMGVLSGDEIGVPGLARVGAGRTGGGAQVARLDAASFPTHASLLDSYQVIALSRFDTGSLSKEQLQALEVWVGRGGTLLVAGGPEWKRTLSALPPSLLPVAVSGVKDVDAAPLGALTDKPLTGKLTVSDGKALRGDVLAAAGDTPLVVVDRVGTGKVVYLAADPSLEPMVGWPGQAGLLERALGVTGSADAFDTGNAEGAMQMALQQLPGLGLPSTGMLGLLLGGYMLLVGPVSYWLLKRKDRREWMWVTVPVLSLGFVAVVYTAGFGKQFAVISHVITATELSPGTQAASMTSYVGVYAPSKNSLEINLGNAQLVRPLMTYGGGPDGQGTLRISYGDRTTVDLLNLNNYSMKAFSVEQDVAVKGGLELTGVSVDDSGRLTASVINRLDRTLSGVMVGNGQNWQQIGDLAPGQTSASFTLDLAPAGGFKGMPIMNIVGPMGPDVTQQRRNFVLQGALGWEGSRVRPGTVAVAGWADQPLAESGIPAPGHVERSTNLVWASLPVPVDLAKAEVPPGVVVGVRTGGPNSGRTPYGYSLTQGATTFALTLPAIDPKQVAEVRVHTSIFGSGSGWTLEAKDQQTGNWVALDNSAVQALPDWQRFVGSGGLMELRINVNDHLEMAAPTISVKGVSR